MRHLNLFDNAVCHLISSRCESSRLYQYFFDIVFYVRVFVLEKISLGRSFNHFGAAAKGKY